MIRERFTILFLIYLALASFNRIHGGVIYHLDGDDFQEIIENSEDVWLISLYTKDRSKHDEELYKLERKYRGLFKIGKMGKDEYEKRTKMDSEINTFIILPYGINTKMKKNKQISTNSLDQAEILVRQNIPDHTIKLPNSMDGTNEKLRGFVQDAYQQTKPTRFPVVFFTETDETPLEFKILCLKYSTLFSFGIIYQPTDVTKQSYTISRLPHVTALLVTDLQKTQPVIRKLPYIEEFYGPFQYSYLVRYLYLLHQNHYHDLPLAKVNKADIDLDSIFFDDIRQFRDDYSKVEIKPPNERKIEL